MTNVGARRGGLALGALALAAAFATGSSAFAIAGVGFLLAGAVTWLWTWFAERPVRVALTVHPHALTEGDRARIEVEIERGSRILSGSISAKTTIGRLGARSTALRAEGRRASGEIDLGEVSRGVYAVTGTQVLLGDLLGLVSVSPTVVCDPATLTVRPRLVALDGLFSDAGRQGGAGRRVLLRRTAGFDLHSVREYEQGESLRRVHWPTSARRGQLMVKELEDAAQDGVVVVLDCDPTGAVGRPPGSSFDVAVRAAGSLVQAHAAQGRTVTLVCTGRGRTPVSVRSAAGDLNAVVNELAAAEPDAPHGVGRFLGGAERALAGGGELVVVTATVEQQAFAALLALSARRLVSVVWIDAASFAVRPTRAEPGLLRLSAHGVPTAVVRRGEDLVTALSAPRLEAAARG
jgi:uncharacterized protein (DUF58 family)